MDICVEYIAKYITPQPDFIIHTYCLPQLVCEAGTPCEYTEEVDLRLIIMSYNRAGALTKLLESLAVLDTMGDTVALDIWIDRSKDGKVHAETLDVARQATWNKGTMGSSIYI